MHSSKKLWKNRRLYNTDIRLVGSREAKVNRMFFRKSLKKLAREVYELNKNSFKDGPSAVEYWKGIEDSPMVDTYPEDPFTEAWIILKGSEEVGLARQFLEESKKLNEYIFNHLDILQKSNTIISYPRNLAGCLRIDAYCDLFMDQGLDADKLLQASQYYEQYFVEKQAPYLDFPDEIDFYIWNQAIVTALLADSLERAQSLVDNLPKPYKASKAHIEYLARLIQYSQGQLNEENMKLFEKEFIQYFDLIRDARPDQKKKLIKQYGEDFYLEPVMGYIETSMLLEKYIFNHNRPLDWKKVIENCIN